MKRMVFIFFLSFTLAQSLETSLQLGSGQAIQPTIIQVTDIMTLLSSAKDMIFLATPVISPGLEQELVGAASRGVKVYFVTLTSNPNAAMLATAGLSVRTLEQFAEGVLLVDSTLIAGGLLSGSEQGTLQIDTALYGTTVTDQLRAVWQLAKPLGG
jgi:hypothetical protein